MTETDRNFISKRAKTEFIYEEEFIDKVFLGCFVQRVYVVIYQRTLYLYHNKSHYRDNPSTPFLFFNLNHMNSTLTEDSVQISNGFTQYTLKHDCPHKLLDLLEAINRGRANIGPQELYPKKFIYLDSIEFRSED